MVTKTALVTGGSSGIGLALAHELARGGYDVALVAHDEVKLDHAITLLRGTFPKRTFYTIAKNLSKLTSAEEIYIELTEKKIQIEVLVNNAGTGQRGAFHEVPLEKHLQIMRVNMIAVVQLTGLFLPEMLNRNSGKVLNVGSINGFQPGPLLSVYNASKAFIVSFSEALSEEVTDTGVTVTCLCPGPTTTDFFEKAGMEDTRVVREVPMMSPEEVAKAGYRAMEAGERIHIPGMQNKIMTFMRRVMPNDLQAKLQKKFYEEVSE